MRSFVFVAQYCDYLFRIYTFKKKDLFGYFIVLLMLLLLYLQLFNMQK